MREFFQITLYFRKYWGPCASTFFKNVPLGGDILWKQAIFIYEVAQPLQLEGATKYYLKCNVEN